MAQFEYTKDMIYAEFKEATAKDEKSKKPSYKQKTSTNFMSITKEV